MPAATIPADRTLTVLETATYDDDLVHKVKLPPEAEGWIALNHLRPATPAQVATWEAAVDASREMAQGEFGRPAVYRISDPEETDRGFHLYGLPTLLDRFLQKRGLRPRRVQSIWRISSNGTFCACRAAHSRRPSCRKFGLRL